MVLLLGRATCHGTVSIESRAGLLLPRNVAQKLPVRVRHTLPPSLVGEAHPGAAVELDIQGDYGRRRFLPSHGAEVMIQHAWALGFPFLIEDRQLDAAHRQSYRAMKFLFDLVSNGQRRIRRRLDRADELEVRGTKARRGEDRSLLPPDLGLDACGHGIRWSVSQLLAEGRDRAAEDGLVEIDEGTAIRYGLLAAAQRNPFLPVLDERKSVTIVRQALFDEQRVTETATPEVIDEVEERFMTTLWRRSEMPWEQMRDGLMGPKNNFVTCLARISGANGRKLTTEQAKAEPCVLRRCLRVRRILGSPKVDPPQRANDIDSHRRHQNLREVAENRFVVGRNVRARSTAAAETTKRPSPKASFTTEISYTYHGSAKSLPGKMPRFCREFRREVV